MSTRESSPVLVDAEFSSKLVTYWVLDQVRILLLSLVGILLIPIWIPVAVIVSRRRFASLRATLTTTSLVVKDGVIVRSERTIPLDKIQDLSLRTGPLLNYMGLAALRIETGGQSAQGGSEANLIGLVAAEAFRDRVLRQRDLLAAQSTPAIQAPQGSAASGTTDELLREIRDSVREIQRRLEERS